MNILIVGNGFDLSHYLPTKYDHFMDVMRAIEEKDLGKPITDVLKSSVDDFPTLLIKILQLKNAFNEKNYEMSFHELFSKCREKWFIDKTKSFYSTNEIKLSFEQIIEIQYLLKSNSWYQYFKQHVREIKTWIDFEQKIEEVLVVFSKMLLCLEKNEINFEDLEFSFSDVLDKSSVKILKFFRLFNEIGGNIKINGEYVGLPAQVYLNSSFCHGNSLINGFSHQTFLTFLQNQLDDFIRIFNLYLDLIVNNLISKNTFEIFVKSKALIRKNENVWINPDRIYSFNYTNTYQRIHDNSIEEVEYLHGSHGKEQNIVLGISDLEAESLKKIKAYGFTKYHQKLFKDTDYLFLDGYKKIIQEGKSKLDKHKLTNYHDFQSEQRALERIHKLSQLNLNFYIWGHSLDVSDKDYILDLFSLNDDMDRNVRVTVYHFNKNAKFDLLNNLLAILGKDKVEHWMKNKWLQFKENPEVKFG